MRLASELGCGFGMGARIVQCSGDDARRLGVVTAENEVFVHPAGATIARDIGARFPEKSTNERVVFVSAAGLNGMRGAPCVTVQVQFLSDRLAG